MYAIAERHDLIVTNVFHAGDGNLHPLLSFDRRVPGTLERVLRASEELVRLCVDAGGASRGEHGIGLEKRDFMPLVFTEEDLSAQACVRAAFDPDGRMNPHKVLPAGARCGDYAAAAWRRRGSRRERAAGGLVDLIHPQHGGGRRRGAPPRQRRSHAPARRGRTTHIDKGNPTEVDAELWTTQLDRLVAYEPAEMLAVVEAGVRVDDLARLLAEGGQEWPVDAPRRRDRRGVIAAGAASAASLRVGTSATPSSRWSS